MNSFSTFPNSKPHWVRRTFSSLLVVWLNLAIQPCAMAFGSMEDHDCLHCPPAHDEQHVDHDMQGHDMSGHDMAGHDNAAALMPCATGASDCSLADELNYDGRIVKLEPKDSPSDLPIAISPALDSERVRRLDEYVGWYTAQGPPPAPSVPLNVYYCVYLK